ncbi:MULTISPECIES: 50S ribosomal protein L29 [Polynucleobacter]|jgi:large subunit ribosomal protein L29|uniref:Large ribosomal subunit protein uL29 n=2 Tax=Polynucleobacter TaxID=44013 RepID=A0A191UCI9_9BURK|nr:MULTISPECIES: 50S ribosomal protein L29 [Polynucleobacter]ANI98682.1 50S ribosomal protein L29 [Polynucleobacter wuianus]MBU3553238.1 50S ribosomal protein L29 [Polynucleobacter sp. MWH-Post4-6-1]QKM63807.1 50S ribosomal protein L29 [Polynucleobacter tropicus]QWD62105.1 50S ribosomal protein L29 [Polynucleobacter sp. MWH-UH25E]QWD64120.1 50S ribosomal protein L29 [Polynucleobacter sp. MWH-UH2A]
MKNKELAAKDLTALNAELTELLKTNFKLRMQKGTQQLTNTSQLGKTKRDIARVKTFIAQKTAQK